MLAGDRDMVQRSHGRMPDPLPELGYHDDAMFEEFDLGQTGYRALIYEADLGVGSDLRWFGLRVFAMVAMIVAAVLAATQMILRSPVLEPLETLTNLVAR